MKKVPLDQKKFMQRMFLAAFYGAMAGAIIGSMLILMGVL